MICGTMVMEDTVIHYVETLEPEPGYTVTVADAHTGKQETRFIPSRSFAAILALAADHSGMDGDPSQDTLYTHAEPHAGHGDLRMIP